MIKLIRAAMAQVHINNIVVGNNPAPVLSPLQFSITFESFNALPGTFDWKLIYIGSPDKPEKDQIIDNFDMDGVPAGVMQFTVDSNPPDFSVIPPEEIVGMFETSQELPPSLFLRPTRSRSSSAAGTTCATATRRASNRSNSVPTTSTSTS